MTQRWTTFFAAAVLVAATAVVGSAQWPTTAQVRYIEPIGTLGQGTTPPDPLNHVFTYSIIETEAAPTNLLPSIKKTMTPILDDAGATLYSVWVPVRMPDSAPFEGLTATQLALMAAWPDQDIQISALDATLTALDGVSRVTTNILIPIYLAESLAVPTEAGFYVHREELYHPLDVNEAVRLSQEAWKTWESTFGTRVTGLFREQSDSIEVASLLRIVWYRSFDGWLDSRDAARDPEARRRFAARRLLQLEGSGVAIATDRAVQ